MRPKVSVIIPTYNAAPFLEEAMRSVLNQTASDFEIIVVDDGSRDETRQIISRLQPTVRSIYQMHEGRAAARNAGLKAAQGEYIAFLDADDVWKPDRLERGIQILDRKPEIGLLHGEVEIIDATGGRSDRKSAEIRKWYRVERKKGSGYLRLLEGSAIFSSTILFRRACLDRVGFYDPAFPILEDYDWYLRFALLYPIHLMEGPPAALYRVHEGNAVSQYDPKTIAQTYIAILERQLIHIRERYVGSQYDQAQSRALARLSEFHSVCSNREEVRGVLLNAFRLNPAIVFNRHFLKRLVFSFLTSGNSKCGDSR